MNNKPTNEPPPPTVVNPSGLQWVKDHIVKRIKQLLEIDADFCNTRWDANKTVNEKKLARDMSNETTARRHELENLLKAIPSTPPPQPLGMQTEVVEYCGICGVIDRCAQYHEIGNCGEIRKTIVESVSQSSTEEEPTKEEIMTLVNKHHIGGFTTKFIHELLSTYKISKR